MLQLNFLNEFRHRYIQFISTRLSLYAQPIQETRTFVGAVDEMVRWMDVVDIQGDKKVGLFMHPISSARFEILVEPDTKFEAYLALLPEAWEQNTDGVEFVLIAEAEGIPRLEKKIFLQPNIRTDQRGWNKLEIDLNAFSGKTIQLVLTTQILLGSTTAHAWAVWGSPCFVTKKSIKTAMKIAWKMAREEGFCTALRHSLDLLQGKHKESTPYLLWQMKHGLKPEEVGRVVEECELFSYQPTISIITPVYNVDSKWLKMCIESVRAQYYPKWELCLCDDGSTRSETLALLRKYMTVDPRIKVKFADQNSGIAGASNQALDLATGEYIGLLDNDDELVPEALYEVVKLLQDHKDADMVYSDEDKMEEDGTRSEPFFKPDWSPEYFLTCNYVNHFTLYRRQLVEQVGRFRSAYDKAQDYDLALRVIERSKSIYHIPKILYHWRKLSTSTASSSRAKDMDDSPAKRALEGYLQRNHIAAIVEVDSVTSYHRIKYQIQGEPLVSIIIPFKDKVELLKMSVSSILQKTDYDNFELLLVSNNSLQPETAEYVKQLTQQDQRIKPLEYNVPFNFSTINNWAVSQSTGEHVVLLNNDVEVISPGWLRSMLELSQQPEIGMVGAKLYYPDGRIQHVGVIIGICGGASHAFIGKSRDSIGYFASTKVIKNYSAVTAACAMVKRKVYEEVGGFDEKFRIDYNDVDLCLRIANLGYRNVFTPYAELYHHESASIGSRVGKVELAEKELLNARWAKVISNDPYYNPNLTLQDTNYQIRL